MAAGAADVMGRLRMWRLAAALAACAAAAGCATRQAVPVPRPAPPLPVRSAVGVASWYGPGFNGHRTANGEIYDENDMTAASNIFPLDSRVVVTDLANGRVVEVRINDRGPYVKGRKIDLSYAAARSLRMVGPGTATVRMDLVRTSLADQGGSPQYFVQVGSFAERQNAERLRARLAARYNDVAISELDTGTGRYYRVRMGGFASRGQARERGAQAARLGLPIIIVRE